MVITIDGTVVTTETRIIDTKQSNDEIEDKKIIIKDNSLDEAKESGILVSVVDGSETDYYITGYDDFVLTARAPESYTHSMILLGVEKLLERETLTSLKFTMLILAQRRCRLLF